MNNSLHYTRLFMCVYLISLIDIQAELASKVATVLRTITHKSAILEAIPTVTTAATAIKTSDTEEAYILPIDNKGEDCFNQTKNWTETNPKVRNILLIQKGQFGYYIRSIGLDQQISQEDFNGANYYPQQRENVSSLNKIPASNTAKELIALKLGISKEDLVYYSNPSFFAYAHFNYIMGHYMRPNEAKNTTHLQKSLYDSNLISEVPREEIWKKTVDEAFRLLNTELDRLRKFAHQRNTFAIACMLKSNDGLPAYLKRAARWKDNIITSNTVFSDNLNDQSEKEA